MMDPDKVMIAHLTRQLEIAREALETIGQCNASMNGHIARSALAQIDAKS
jgi:hypothetical protein